MITKRLLSGDPRSTQLWCFEAFVRLFIEWKGVENWLWPLHEEACLSLFTYSLLISVSHTHTQAQRLRIFLFCFVKPRSEKSRKSRGGDISSKQQMQAKIFICGFSMFSNHILRNPPLNTRPPSLSCFSTALDTGYARIAEFCHQSK